MFQIKQLTDLEDIKKVELIEEQVWNMAPTPYHQTFTAVNNGGMIIGAYKNQELIGFLYGFPGFRKGETYLCSHMLGILPQHQKSGLGKEMKEVQREVAIKLGYSLIVWTFDPLESVNAYLNVHKLKGITASYLENHYGSLNDSLNQGLPTDRFLVEWWIRSNHVEERTLSTSLNSMQILLKSKLYENNLPVIISEWTEGQVQHKTQYAVPIPENFQLMKKDNPKIAMDWRMKTRTVFQSLLSNGFVAVDVVRSPENGVSYYVFKQRKSLLV
jgi:predicted GNAT superfamily acetyltransferase